MRIPKEDRARMELYIGVRETCLASRVRRMDQYALWRRYFLYGNSEGSIQTPWNMIYNALDLLTSFLYSAESTKFSVRLAQDAPEVDYKRIGPFAKRINKRWGESNADLVFAQCLLWSLIYDSTFFKLIRQGGELHPFMVDPGSFGVYREDVPMLDRQEAFAHVYYMTTTELERKLAYHPKRDEILSTVNAAQSKEDIAQRTPPFIDRVIMSAVTPNVIGEANIPLDAPPDYEVQLPKDLVEMCELWVWDDANDDYQTITMASPEVVVYDRPNIFMPKMPQIDAEQPFVQLCPNPLPDYFFGQSEVSRLAPLQQKLDERMEQIERLLAKEVDPPTGWTGQGLIEDKLASLNDPGAQIAIGGDAGMGKAERYAPNVPADVYKSVEFIKESFLEAMGLSNVLLGRGEAGVRSGGHAAKLANLGSSRPKKRALVIEESLEKAATLYSKAIFNDDDQAMKDDAGQDFIAAQMAPGFHTEVDAHSNSPVFRDNLREDATMLLKSKSITRARFIEMIGPPKTEELIHELNTVIIPGEKAAAEQRQQAEVAAAQAKAGGGKLQSVK